MDKQISLHKLKIGDKLRIFDLFNQPQSAKVLAIKKEKGIFTGRTVYRVIIDHPELTHISFHGKGRLLPAEKATIIV